ncbi:MAG: hypothetical protein E7231_01185 [Cellulosilyticum sp.]|nr:hypothetical protein [Cellulosilyticum sp.]
MACRSFDCRYFKLNRCRKDKDNPCSCTRNTEDSCAYINELLRNNSVLCIGCKNSTCEAGYLYFSQLNKEEKEKVEAELADVMANSNELPLEFDEEPIEEHVEEKEEPVVNNENDIKTALPATAYVDGSFNQNTNTYGYGLVMMVGLDTYEYYGANNNSEVAKIRNVAGELLGAMTSVQKAKSFGCNSLIICYDYEGIEKWVTGAWKANNEFTQKYKAFMQGCGLKIRFKKVKAHSGECFNEQADRLAKKAVGV